MKVDCENLYFKFNKIINVLVNKYYDGSDKKVEKETLYEIIENYLIKNKSSDIINCVFCNLEFEIDELEIITYLSDKFR